jgi:hypothetical protein
MLTTSEVMTNWQQLGFDNPSTARQITEAAALLETDIPARRRQHLVRAWAAMNTPPGGSNTTHGPNDPPGPPTTGGYTFIATATHVSGKPVATVAFQASIFTKLPLEISPTLPHCAIPIGTQYGKGKLKVAMDSCAGVNIGHLQFHQAMYETFPGLIKTFKTMTEYGEENVMIGGVEASAAGNLELTHIIEYKTPYHHRGEPCTLVFGLSEKAAAAAILSINFLRKTKALWSYDDAAPNVHLTIWNTSLAVQYEAPTRRPPPTPQTRFQQEATVIYTATTGHE